MRPPPSELGKARVEPPSNLLSRKRLLTLLPAAPLALSACMRPAPPTRQPNASPSTPESRFTPTPAATTPRADTKPTAAPQPPAVDNPATSTPKPVLSSKEDRLLMGESNVNSADSIWGKFAHAQVVKPPFGVTLSKVELAVRKSGNPQYPLGVAFAEHETLASMINRSPSYKAPDPIIAHLEPHQVPSEGRSITIPFREKIVMEPGKEYGFSLSGKSVPSESHTNSYIWSKNDRVKDNKKAHYDGNTWIYQDGRMGYGLYVAVDAAEHDKRLQQEPLVPFSTPLYKMKYPQSWARNQYNDGGPNNQMRPLTSQQRIEAFTGPDMFRQQAGIVILQEQINASMTLREYQEMVEAQTNQLPFSGRNTTDIKVGRDSGKDIGVFTTEMVYNIAIVKRGQVGWKIIHYAHPLTAPEQISRFKSKILPAFEIT